MIEAQLHDFIVFHVLSVC